MKYSIDEIAEGLKEILPSDSVGFKTQVEKILRNVGKQLESKEQLQQATAIQVQNVNLLPDFLREEDGRITVGVYGDTDVTQEWQSWLSNKNIQQTPVNQNDTTEETPFWKELFNSESKNAHWEIFHNSDIKIVNLLYVQGEDYSDKDVMIPMEYDRFEELIAFLTRLGKPRPVPDDHTR